MAVMINYTAAQYEAKIAELEGYYNQLVTHEERMVSLKENMYDFWKDDQCQATGRILEAKIRLVQTAMDTTSATLNQYKVAVKELNATKGLISDTLEKLLLGLLGL